MDSGMFDGVGKALVTVAIIIALVSAGIGFGLAKIFGHINVKVTVK